MLEKQKEVTIWTKSGLKFSGSVSYAGIEFVELFDKMTRRYRLVSVSDISNVELNNGPNEYENEIGTNL